MDKKDKLLRAKTIKVSVARSLTTGRLASGASVKAPSRTTVATRVRQVQRGRPFTVIAHDPHMPTRHAKRYDRLGSKCRWIHVTTSRTV